MQPGCFTDPRKGWGLGDRVLSVLTHIRVALACSPVSLKTWQRPTLPRLETQYHGR